MEKNQKLKTAGVIYSVLSGILIVPLFTFALVMSVFASETGVSLWAFLIAGSLFSIPFILLLGNTFMWWFIKKGKERKMIFSMAVPIGYSFLVFVFLHIFGYLH